MLQDVASCGSFQMNHVWFVTLHSLSARHKLLGVKEMLIKEMRCLVLDPNKAEVRLKLHWIPFHLPNDSVKKALKPYGTLEEITREKWQVEVFWRHQIDYPQRQSHAQERRDTGATATSAPPPRCCGLSAGSREGTTLPAVP